MSTINSDANVIFRFPKTGARVVLRAYVGGGDLLNAWEVLVGAIGTQAARVMVKSVDDAHPDDLFDEVMAALGQPPWGPGVNYSL